MGDLDGHPDSVWLRASRIEDPVCQFCKAGPAVPESSFSKDTALPVHEADLVQFRAPVDPHKELKIFHDVPFDQSPQRAATMPSGPCTGALGANSPLGHGQGSRHRPPPPGAQGTGGDGLLSIPWPGSSRMDENRMIAGSPDELELPVLSLDSLLIRQSRRKRIDCDV